MNNSQRQRTTKLIYDDGFESPYMTDEQLECWFKMNNENSVNIKAMHTQELCTREEAEELLRKYNVKS